MERQIQKILERKLTLEGAGVKLKRVLGHDNNSALDPFLLLDHFGSEDPVDYIKGFLRIKLITETTRLFCSTQFGAHFPSGPARL